MGHCATARREWTLIADGALVGGLFAAYAFAVSVLSVTIKGRMEP